ncbi:PREDICTED: proteasome assembly chaperone 2 [Nicrophorus vespilloides]|uniref:Proteasome assembly chaperone 2 n=1 Tax=Nicrophorus vespilloides TaxID=110193 RepID=A0ABM1ME54_NICVS|nr:PREDICTED: proteasome assembly chaperone 2 [Nicrophorus vespilloides]
MCELIKFNKETSLKDYTLYIPNVSIGNVPQLTVDLLISTYNLKKIATVWHPAIIPTVGSDPFDLKSKDVCTACELYANEDLKVAVVQLRSGLERGLKEEFLKKLIANIKEFELKRIVLLTSIFAFEMHNVNSSKFMYISNENAEIFKDCDATEETNLDLVSEGFVCPLFTELKDSVPCTILTRYCYEGDNRLDAVHTINLLGDIFKEFTAKEDFKFPISWEYLFGNPVPIEIY